jgi:hypothetical protein
VANAKIRVSYFAGERADCLLRGTPTQWLEAASQDFAGFVAAQRGVQVRWSVPSTIFWYVSGEYYLGTLVRPDGRRRGEDRFWIDLSRS